MRSPRIGSFPARALPALDPGDYDAALASLGFETRSRRIPERLADVGRRTVIPFADRHELDYAKNERFFKEHSWEIAEVPEEKIVDWTGVWLAELATGCPEPVRIAVDISSMSRVRIGAVIQALLNLPLDARAQVDLLYTPAKFEPPPEGSDPQVFEVGPVSQYFAGWWTDLSAPLIAVIGVGYEREMAASAIDKLEPERTIVFSPCGEDSRYATEVTRANRALLEPGEEDSHVTEYEVADPFACFYILESTLARLERRFRVVMVPLGPKIFAACTLLAAGLHPQSSQVVRVSAGDRQEGIDRESNGKLCGLRVLVVPQPDGAEPAGG